MGIGSAASSRNPRHIRAPGHRQMDNAMTRRLVATCAATVLLLTGPLVAQQKATITGVPDIPFSTVPNFLKLPPGE